MTCDKNVIILFFRLSLRVEKFYYENIVTNMNEIYFDIVTTMIKIYQNVSRVCDDISMQLNFIQ